LRKRNAWLLIAIIGTFVFVFYYANPIGYVGGLRVYNEAIGHLARAESAQTPDEVIEHVTVAKDLLPAMGDISSLSHDRGNFETIQAKLDDIIGRARNISSLDSGNELFISEMFAIHAELEDIQETLA
jgi:hypothetical protein